MVGLGSSASASSTRGGTLWRSSWPTLTWPGNFRLHLRFNLPPHLLIATSSTTSHSLQSISTHSRPTFMSGAMLGMALPSFRSLKPVTLRTPPTRLPSPSPSKPLSSSAPYASSNRPLASNRSPRRFATTMNGLTAAGIVACSLTLLTFILPFCVRSIDVSRLH